MTCSAETTIRGKPTDSPAFKDWIVTVQCQREDPHPGALHGAGGYSGADYYTVAWGPSTDVMGEMTYGS